MCDLTKLAAGNGQPAQKANPDRERRLPERSPDRDLENAREQPNPSPVFQKHEDSPERDSETASCGAAAIKATSAAPSSARADKPQPQAELGGSADAPVAAVPGGKRAAKKAAATFKVPAATAPTTARGAAATSAPKRSANAVAEADSGARAHRPTKSQGVSRGSTSGSTAGKKARHDGNSATSTSARTTRARLKSRDPLLGASLLARHIPADNSAAQIRHWFSQFGEVTAVMLTASKDNDDEVQALVTFASEEQCDQARARCVDNIADLRQQQQKKKPAARKVPDAATAVADSNMAGIIRQAVAHMHACGINTDPWPIQPAPVAPRARTPAAADMHRNRKRKQSDGEPWTEQETARLLEAAYRTRATNWPKIVRYVGGRSEAACQLQLSAVLRQDPQRVEAAALLTSSYTAGCQDEARAQAAAPKRVKVEGPAATSKRVKLVVGSKPAVKASGEPDAKASDTQQTISPNQVPWTPKEDTTLAKLVRSQVSRKSALTLTKDDWTEIAVHLNDLLQTGRSNKDCYVRWVRHVRPAMVKAAEHLRAKKAAAAAAATAAAASAGNATSAAESTQVVQAQPSIKTDQAASDQTARVSNLTAAPAAPTAPKNGKPASPTTGVAGLPNASADAEVQPAQIIQPKTIPVSKPPMVRPAAAPNSKQAIAPSMANPVGGQTKDGYRFEMAMRREHSDLCSRLPANVLEITRQTLTDLYSGSEIARLCGNTHEWKRSKHIVADRLLRLLLVGPSQ